MIWQLLHFKTGVWAEEVPLSVLFCYTFRGCLVAESSSGMILKEVLEAVAFFFIQNYIIVA
jgi:hypothetical protein